MIRSIIRAKMFPASKYDYFYSFDSQHTTDIIKTLKDANWWLIENQRIVKRDCEIEEGIFDEDVGSVRERELLRKYYKMQK